MYIWNKKFLCVYKLTIFGIFPKLVVNFKGFLPNFMVLGKQEVLFRFGLIYKLQNKRLFSVDVSIPKKKQNLYFDLMCIMLCFSRLCIYICSMKRLIYTTNFDE